MFANNVLIYLFCLGIYIPQTKRYFLESHSGIWRICRTVLIPKALPMKDLTFNITNFNDTVIETTVRTNHFPDPKTAAPRSMYLVCI